MRYDELNCLTQATDPGKRCYVNCLRCTIAMPMPCCSSGHVRSAISKFRYMEYYSNT